MAVYEMWQDALHLETMISPYFTHIGAGVGRAGDWVYYTIVVGYISGSPGTGSDSQDSPAPNTVQITPAPTAIPVQPILTATPGTDGSIIHIVQAGHFLENIANSYEVNLADLMTLNGFNEQTVIFPGEKILIRPAQTPENPQDTLELEIEFETTSAPTQLPTPTLRPPTSTPSPVAVAQNIPPQVSPTMEEPTESVESTENDEGGSDVLLYAVFGLAFAGMALVLFGSTLKKRS
jgi:LysM repeat protein